MASSKELLRQLNDISECSICTESFKDPKVLPCFHTFCLGCLEKFGKGKKSGENINCPLCRTIFTIPRGGFKELPNNNFIIDLSRVNRLSTGELKPQDCDLCSEQNDKPRATVYCVACEQHLCEPCCGRHKKVRATKGHKVVDIKDKPNTEQLRIIAPSYCEKHPSKEIEFFCYDCKMIACYVCCVESHNTHKCNDVKKSADEYCFKIKDDIEKLMPYILKTKEKLRQVEVCMRSVMSKVESTKKEIYNKYDELRALLDMHKKELTMELDSFQSKSLKELEIRKEEVERQLLILESFSRYCEEIKDKGTSCDISRAAGDLHARAEELLKSHEEFMTGQIVPSVDTEFTPYPTIAGKNIIGELSHTSLSAKAIDFKMESFNATSLFDQPKLHHIVGICGYIRGITIIGNELFIASEVDANIYIYDTKSFTLARQILIPGRTGASAITACSHNNCLYVSTIEDPLLHRFDLQNNSTITWKLEDVCSCLSVAIDCTLLVTLVDRILEYTTKGEIVRKIAVSGGSILSSVQLSSGNFVAGQRGNNGDTVKIINSSGQVLKTCELKGLGDGKLSYPRHLTIDQNDNVIVADNKNSRLVVFSPALSLLSCIETPGRVIAHPSAVCFDAFHRYLYVGELFTGNVLVLGTSGSNNKKK